MENDNWIIHALEMHGYRITRSRRKIADLLLRRKEPFTIQEFVKESSHTDAVSVYRTIELLEREGLIARVYGHTDSRYELAHGHHHHLICTDCGRTEHMPCDGIRSLRLPKSFKKVSRHDVTLYGLCGACG